MARPSVSPRAQAVARGDEPADLLIRGGRVLSPAAHEWIITDLAIADGVVCGWGPRDAHNVLDVGGAAIVAGFVDAHMHLESTKLWVDEFVRTVLPLGTTAVAADPHEIANVLGIAGVAGLQQAASRLPFTFGITASSCVPASPFESSGAQLDHRDVAELINSYGALGVAEVMNFPGVIAGDPEMLARIGVANGRRVDGHAPLVRGRDLDAYLAAGVESDHECTLLEEAEEKRAKGMWVFIRQGSASQNLHDLIPMVLRGGIGHVALCSDDREPDTLLSVGHLNDCINLAIKEGVDEIDAFIMATMNPAEYHGFHHLGSLGPGYQADLCIFDTIEGVQPAHVYQRGQLVASNGVVVPGAVEAAPAPEWMRETIHLASAPAAASLDLKAPPSTKARIIGIENGSLTTKSLEGDPFDEVFNTARLAVLERHHATGRIGLGWVSGFGLERGAFASTVGHDAHNVMAVASRHDHGPAAMAAAIEAVSAMGGGQVVVDERGTVLASLPLPIAGLMSDQPAEIVGEGLDRLLDAARGLGVSIKAPFMHLSFLGLSVIPELRLTDQGLIDVNAFEIVAVDL